MPVLTDRGVAQVEPQAKRFEIADVTMPGLYLVVQPSGVKSWAVRLRRDGKPAKITLRGRYPVLPLSMARIQAQRTLQRAAIGAADDETLVDAVAEFELKHVAKLRPSTQVYARRVLARALKAWPDRPLATITRRDVIALVDDAAQHRGPAAANTTWKVLGKFFRWCEGRDKIALSPKRGVEKPHKETERDRVLTDAELVKVWTASGHFVRLLLLTGCRRNEIAALSWPEVSADAINLPALRTKTGVAHRVPLTDLMKATLPPKRGRYVMTGTDKPLSPGSLKPKVSIPPWTLHDLRRSFASGLGRLGVAPHVIERMLNHKVKGVARIYNRHQYEDECAAAWRLWSDHIAKITAIIAP
jgi:integrase